MDILLCLVDCCDFSVGGIIYECVLVVRLGFVYCYGDKECCWFEEECGEFEECGKIYCCFVDEVMCEVLCSEVMYFLEFSG